VGSALISAMVESIEQGDTLDSAMDAAASLLREIRAGIDTLH
jgi:hypothetical protein